MKGGDDATLLLLLYVNLEHKTSLKSHEYICSKSLWYIVCVMNLVTTHYNCTSPMDYISHHALHTHIPVHHYTNHTAVTIHSLVLIVSPHLHLIHSHTFKQHSHLHSLRSLVSPWLTFPSICPSLSFRVLPGLLTSSPDRLLPASLTSPG